MAAPLFCAPLLPVSTPNVLSSPHLRIATRSSPLALWQAALVRREVLRYCPDAVVELREFTTRGDILLDTSLSKIGGKALFVKELEHALLAGEADIAVHSMKDLPMVLPDGLHLGSICARGEPLDAWVSHHFAHIHDMPAGARVGTSSLRRQSQLRRVRPDLQFLDLRGNINTRLNKLDAGAFDAIVLAGAGLERLGLQARICTLLSPELSLPAGGQGAVGIELRANDAGIAALIAPLHCEKTARCVLAERALNRHLQGGCQVPIACYAVLENETLFLRGLVGSVDGAQILEASARSTGCPEALGVQVAEQLLAAGAAPILAAVYAQP